MDSREHPFLPKYTDHLRKSSKGNEKLDTMMKSDFVLRLHCDYLNRDDCTAADIKHEIIENVLLNAVISRVIYYSYLYIHNYI